MRSMMSVAILMVGCNGGGSPGQRPDGAPGHDGAPPIDGGGADAVVVDGAAPDGGTTTGCASVLAPSVDALAPPAPAATWTRCGGYGSGAVARVNVAASLHRAVIVTEAGEAIVVALPSMTEIASFTHADGQVSFAALSVDGDALATVDDARGDVAVWQVDTRTLLRRFSRAPAWPSAPQLGDVALGLRYLAVISVDHIDVWDLVTGEPLPISARTDLGGGSRIAFAQGDSRLVVGRFSYFGNGPYAGWGAVDIVDTLDGANPVRLDYDFYISLPYFETSALDGGAVAVAGDGSGDGTVALFDTATGARLPVATITGLPLGLSNDLSQIAVREPDAITRRRTRDGALLATIPAPGAGPVAVQDLALALIGTRDGVTAVSFDGTTGGTACTVGALEPHDVLTGIALTGDDATLVTTSFQGVHQAWDVATGALQGIAPPAPHVPSATSPDGAMIAIPDAEGTFRVEDIATHGILWTFGPHPTRVTGLDWGGMTRIASTAEREPVDRQDFEPSVRIWSTSLGRMEQVLPGMDNGPALFASPGDRLFITGRGHVIRWCQ